VQKSCVNNDELLKDFHQAQFSNFSIGRIISLIYYMIESVFYKNDLLMQHLLFKIHHPIHKNKALKELIKLGLLDYYLIEDWEEEVIKIGGLIASIPESLHFSEIDITAASIDWENQWKEHSPYFKNGKLEIDLKEFNFPKNSPSLILNPGPGFGDLSHPTTKLMLKLMPRFIEEHDVLDIGCGSGILSCAASFLTKGSIVGIDIDEKALSHSKENANLNNIKASFSESFHLKQLNNNNLCVLMNMISSEQREVFKCYPTLNFKGYFICSGLLKNEEESYIQALPYQNFRKIHSESIGPWVSIVFKAL
jgi:ribosomal protein L11 methyltransferase